MVQSRDPLLVPERERPRPRRPVTSNPATSQGQSALNAGSLTGLQRAAGNQATAQFLQRRESTLTFDTPEVVTGHVTTLGPSAAGGSVATRCANLAIQYERTINLARDNADTALQNFETYMAFPAEAEAEADLMGVATKFALKEGFKALWDYAITPIAAVPGVDKLADLMSTLVEECERADTAAGRIKVREWILEQRGHFQSSFDQTLRAVGDMGMNFERGYAAVLPEGEAASTGIAETGGRAGSRIAAGDRTLVGPGAEYLNRISKAVEDGIEHVPTWQAQLQDMIERWVRRSENTVESRGGGDVYMGGRIYLTVKLLRQDGGYTVTLPTTGHLASAEANRVGDALRRLLAETGQNVNDLAILKVLRVEVEDEVWGFNETYHTVLHYRDPGHIEHRGVNFGPRVTSEYLAKANRIIPEALQQFTLSAIDVRSLSSAAEA